MDMLAVDTARMMNYLEQYAYFETNEHVDITKFAQFDSHTPRFVSPRTYPTLVSLRQDSCPHEPDRRCS